VTVGFDAIVARVWPDGASRWEVLGGGITNHNLKITRPDGVYVLRVAGENSELLGIDRRNELEATRAAAAVGVGPDVVDVVEPEGWLVTRFVQGEIPPPERLREPETLVRVAGALRAVHTGRSVPGRFDAFRVVEGYLTTALERGAELPPSYAWASQIARAVEQHRLPVPRHPCHNDLLHANIIDTGDRIVIVDWEYAGMGDRFFDLANYAVNQDLDSAGRDALLDAYFGSVRVEHRRALELMRFMSDFREAMWGVVQSVVSELDFDFRGYAGELFERMERIAAEPAFRRALAG
jgi:thiamine kinase-like enzyme